MTQRRERSVEFDTTTEKLLQILTNPDFLIADQEADPGTESAQYKELTKTEHKITYHLELTEYGRSMKGSIDKSKRGQAQVSAEWDLEGMCGSWTYASIGSSWADKFRCTGEYRIAFVGDKARLTSTLELQVKIPLMGGSIEKMVVKDIEKSYPRYDNLVREFIQKDS